MLMLKRAPVAGSASFFLVLISRDNDLIMFALLICHVLIDVY